MNEEQTDSLPLKPTSITQSQDAAPPAPKLMDVPAPSHATAGLQRNQLRRSDWYEVVRQCRISILSVVLIVSVFLFVPQAQDVLRSLAEKNASRVFFELFLVMWASAVWYGGRFILDQDFEAMWQPGRKARAVDLWGERFMPRFLGSIGLAGMGWAMVRAVANLHSLPGTDYRQIAVLGGLNIMGGFLFYIFTVKRLDVFNTTAKFVQMRMLRQATSISLTRRAVKIAAWKEFPLWLRVWFWIVLSSSVFFWVLLLWKIYKMSPLFGAASILLLSCSFITIIWTAIVWVGERTRLPMITFVAIYLCLVSPFNQHHDVRTTGSDFSPPIGFTPANHYFDWLSLMDRKFGNASPHPLFLVAASGGGIRAAYWTASVLGKLQEMNPYFAEHTLIISPVSGGALGALVFDTLLTNDQGGYVHSAQSILSQDFLAPALSALLFIDLPLKFLPFPSHLPDRAAILERAWERAWRKRDQSNALQERENLFHRPFSSLLPFEQSHRIPMLLINGTSVYTGQRVITTHLTLGNDFPDVFSTFERWPHDIPISTAAMMSARFTYISPAGRLDSETYISPAGRLDSETYISPAERLDCKTAISLAKRLDSETYISPARRLDSETSVVDGGYFENSGAATALEFYEVILPCIDRSRVTPYFIQIDNDYVATHDTGRTAAEEREAPESRRIFPGEQAPILALLNARNAHAVSLNERAMKLFQKCYFHFTFVPPADDKGDVKGHDVEAPLGWFLSSVSQRSIQQQLDVGSTQVTTNRIGQILTESISGAAAPTDCRERAFTAKSKAGMP